MPETDWRETLAPELKGSPALKDIKDIGALAKGYIEAQSVIGNSVRVPTKEAGEEGRKAFRARILELGKDHGIVALPGKDEDPSAFYGVVGRPEKDDGYELPEFKAEGFAIDDSETKALKAEAHKAGLSKDQFKKFVKGLADVRLTAAQSGAEKFNSGHKALESEWGDQYKSRIVDVSKMLELHKAPDSLRAAMETGKLDADSLRWLYLVLSGYGDEPAELVSQGKRQTLGVKLTRDDARQRLQEIEQRIQVMQPGDPDYQELVQRRVKLVEQAEAA